MGNQRLATITMPFEMWRILLHQGGPITPELHVLGHQATELITMQLAAQSAHANCDPPKAELVRSTIYPDRFMMKVICTCGELLTAADNIPAESLERIGPRGAYRPATKPNA